MPKKLTVPGRIREIRHICSGTLDDLHIEDIETIIREFAQWLSDPTVPDELRSGDRALFEKLHTYWAVRVPLEPAIQEALLEARHHVLQ